ncbi:formiminoglutamase [Winogradskyella epiphytica]|uniref:Formiminoglutamase n=1 Tax=Winogradskyella epiphytica TaxID=262005 RepID=A0A2V4YE40_9FLAO|nr:formimidoylglutamase [Winogradskyella epiphytica]PYE81747.1 formiminoglutamase [Winogradskyella epiphytica]GGW62952.1 arginase [Winogradskyella epiphytica]
MQHLILFTEKEKRALLNKRKSESKFGEHIKLPTNLTNIYEDINNLDVDYVLFGIKEDIGVYGNLGNPGTSKAWDATLKVLLNIQENSLTNPKRVLILGHLDYSEKREELLKLDLSKKKERFQVRDFVENIDKDVSHIVATIVKAGKNPIIIGGGHNNAYGNIKGTSLGKNDKINVVNFDAHTDFRAEEGRHSGNGFTYAFAEGFLKNYFIFGLHENYTSDTIFKTIKKIKSIKFNTYEAIEVRKELDFKSEMKIALEHVSGKSFGIEIDCDAIRNIPSSAMTPSGFSAKKARQFVHYFGKHENAAYLHICEAAPTKKTATKVGKLITYMITDFMRANGN